MGLRRELLTANLRNLRNPISPSSDSGNPPGKYPKMQIRTVKDLLENPRILFEIPDSARSREARKSARSSRGRRR